jgi:hypothetical protein
VTSPDGGSPTQWHVERGWKTGGQKSVQPRSKRGIQMMIDAMS